MREQPRFGIDEWYSFEIVCLVYVGLEEGTGDL